MESSASQQQSDFYAQLQRLKAANAHNRNVLEDLYQRRAQDPAIFTESFQEQSPNELVVCFFWFFSSFFLFVFQPLPRLF